MKRVLVVHRSFNAPGGGSAVAAWALQALRHEAEVTLLTWALPNLERANANAGTDLAPADLGVETMPAWLRRLVDAIPLRLALLKMALLQRHARKLLRRNGFDLVVGTDNEIDIGNASVPAIQYVHYPWAHFPRPDTEYRWYHVAPLLAVYRGGITRLLGLSRARIARNVTLANSAWTSQRFEEWYGAPARVLHPPVQADVPAPSWETRADAFACVGRISPEKRLLEVMDILAEVRRHGHAVGLHIFGYADDADYVRRVRAAAARHGPWVSLELDLPRERLLDRIAACRYGIHGMEGEHFGIALAEMVRLGCVCVAPTDGGPAEILNEPRLLYRSSADAVAKIRALLDDSHLLNAMRAYLRTRAQAFSAERFMRELRGVCEQAPAPAQPDTRGFADLRRWLKHVLPPTWAQRIGRLYRIVYPYAARINGGRTVRVATATGVYHLPCDAPHDVIVRAMRAGDVFDAPVFAAVARELKPGSTVLDVGACFGQMSVLFSRLVGPQGRVYAVEANPFVHGLLTRNLAENGCANARAVFAAAHEKSGKVFRYPEPRFWHHPSYGSYGPKAVGRGAPVPSLALDDLGVEGTVDVLKIDAQGSDLFVMRGARRLIARHHMPILFEYESEYDQRLGVTWTDYDSFIREIGYTVVERIGANLLLRSCR